MTNDFTQIETESFVKVDLQKHVIKKTGIIVKVLGLYNVLQSCLKQYKVHFCRTY